MLIPIENTPPNVFNSQHSTPYLIIKKPGIQNTSVRLVADVRTLNKHLQAYPTTNTLSIEQSTHQLADMSLNTISSLDTSQGYAQIGISKDSWEFSVVTVGMNRYLTDRLTMGAHTTVACWLQYMQKFLGELGNKSTVMHLDDLFLNSKNTNRTLSIT